MSTVAKRDRNKVLDELLQYHEGKLSELTAQRSGLSKPVQTRQISIGSCVSLMIDPRQRKVIVSWEK
jgi:hypothetical protein